CGTNADTRVPDEIGREIFKLRYVAPGREVDRCLARYFPQVRQPPGRVAEIPVGQLVKGTLRIANARDELRYATSDPVRDHAVLVIVIVVGEGSRGDQFVIRISRVRQSVLQANGIGRRSNPVHCESQVADSRIEYGTVEISVSRIDEAAVRA